MWIESVQYNVSKASVCLLSFSSFFSDDERNSGEENHEEEEEEKNVQRSIKESVFSFSSLFYLYWASCNLFSVTLFSTHFNAWINKFAKSQEESKWQSCSLKSMLVTWQIGGLLVPPNYDTKQITPLSFFLASAYVPVFIHPFFLATAAPSKVVFWPHSLFLLRTRA